MNDLSAYVTFCVSPTEDWLPCSLCVPLYVYMHISEDVQLPFWGHLKHCINFVAICCMFICSCTYYHACTCYILYISISCACNASSKWVSSHVILLTVSSILPTPCSYLCCLFQYYSRTSTRLVTWLWSCDLLPLHCIVIFWYISLIHTDESHDILHCLLCLEALGYTLPSLFVIKAPSACPHPLVHHREHTCSIIETAHHTVNLCLTRDVFM